MSRDPEETAPELEVSTADSCADCVLKQAGLCGLDWEKLLEWEFEHDDHDDPIALTDKCPAMVCASNGPEEIAAAFVTSWLAYAPEGTCKTLESMLADADLFIGAAQEMDAATLEPLIRAEVATYFDGGPISIPSLFGK